MRAFALLTLFFVSSWAAPCLYGVDSSCDTSLCSNSPYTASELRTLQNTALAKLGEYHIKKNPFPLIPNLNAKPPLDQTCHSWLARGQVQNCGWAPTFRNANHTGTLGLYDNPDVWYGSIYTGRDCKTTNDQMSFPGDQSFKLRGDEAVVWFGCTPADLQFFSYSRAVVNLTDTQPVQGLLGESLNHLVIKTANKNGTPFGAATLIIYAADQDVANSISNAYIAAGFPAAAINIDPFPVAEVNLGSNGQVSTSTSTLSFISRLYKFNSPDPTYVDCVRSFPYVKFTPLYPKLTINPITEMEAWRPDDAGVLTNSEFGFEPVLQGVASAVQGYTAQTLAAHGYTQISQYAAQPFRTFDLALYWILESRSGVYGTKDCSYSVYPLQLSTNYGSTPGLNFSMACGIDHTSTFTTSVPTLFHKPTALYYNFAAYGAALGSGQVGDTGLAGGITQTLPLNISAFPAAVQTGLDKAFAKIGVAAAPNFYCHYMSDNCALVESLLPAVPCAQLNTNIPNGHSVMPVLFRAYVNPLTMTAPSDVTLLKPIMTFYNYAHA